MAKFRKNAREELLEDIRTRKSPTPPPKSPPPIEAANPYHLLEYEFGKFVGNTKVEILEHDVNKSLDLISRELSHPLPHNLRKAQSALRRKPRDVLATEYHEWKKGQVLSWERTQQRAEYRRRLRDLQWCRENAEEWIRGEGSAQVERMAAKSLEAHHERQEERNRQKELGRKMGDMLSVEGDEVEGEDVEVEDGEIEDLM
jgi:hypothetical protein